MSYRGEHYSLFKKPNISLGISQCGLTICSSGHHAGVLTYSHYSAHFILEGKGVYRVNGKEYKIGPGQGFMIIPNIPNSYTADKEDPWRYIYITFYGMDSKSIVKHAGIDEKDATFSFELDSLSLKDLSKLEYTKASLPNHPAFYSGVFTAKAGVDTFIDMTGWGKV